MLSVTVPVVFVLFPFLGTPLIHFNMLSMSIMPPLVVSIVFGWAM